MVTNTTPAAWSKDNASPSITRATETVTTGEAAKVTAATRDTAPFDRCVIGQITGECRQKRFNAQMKPSDAGNGLQSSQTACRNQPEQNKG